MLYFEPKKPSVAVAAAIERYLASESRGRFIQSLEAYLAIVWNGNGVYWSVDLELVSDLEPLGRRNGKRQR